MSRSVASFFRPQPAAAQRRSQPSLFVPSRAELSPEPASKDRLRQTLRVTVVGARSLRPRGEQVDTYVVCHVPGKSRSRFQTPVVEDTVNPDWNFEGRLPDFAALGDTLVFTVYDCSSERKGNQCDRRVLGTCTLKGRQLSAGTFDAEVPLNDTEGGQKALLKVKIQEEVVHQLKNLMEVLGPRYKALPPGRTLELANCWSQETLMQRKLRHQHELEVSKSESDLFDPVAHLRDELAQQEEEKLQIAGESQKSARKQVASGQSVHRFAASQLLSNVPSIHPGATCSGSWR